MPKIKKLRSHKLAAKPYDEVADATAEHQSSSLSRGQKKRLERKERVEIKIGKKAFEVKRKVKSSVSVDMLSELEASILRESASNGSDIIKPAATMKTNKIKQQVAVREAARMKLVQQHPVFLDNPIGAVKAHLEHMMAIKDKEATSR